MDFQHSERSLEYQGKLTEFMDECVYPAEAVYEQQMRESGDPHHFPAVLAELKNEAKKRGLWNLFHPHLGAGGAGGAGAATTGGDSNRPGLTNAEYAPLAEIMGGPSTSPPRPATAAPPTRATWRSSSFTAPTSTGRSTWNPYSAAKSALPSP